MKSEIYFILQLAVIILAANIGGYISEKLKQPAVLGQIVIGLLLGLLSFKSTDIIQGFAQIGVILLMFIAGLETDVKELTASLKSSSLIALAGVVFPAVLVFGTIYLVHPDGGMNTPLFLGIITTATSVSISVQTLREMKKLRSKQGLMILGAAIIDDVVGIILLTVMVGIVAPGSGKSVGQVILNILILFASIAAFGFVVLKVIKWLGERFDIENKVISFALVICLGLAYFSEELGVAAITGAYFAGLIMSMTSFRHRISHDISIVSSLFFTPVFFVGIGLSINIFEAVHALAIGSILVVMGSLGKLIGCGLGARITGFTTHESVQIGIGMIPRAEVALIIANLGVQIGILESQHIAAAVLMVLVTTLITPALLKWAFSREATA